MLDLVIRGALLIDGKGGPPFAGDLAVSQGKIAGIERAITASARETVDARGLALMPGIIDNHTHYDAQITWDRGLSPSPALGVTTAIIGNCGFTIAPCRPADRELVLRNLTQVEGMSLEVLRQGVRWDFESVPEYLDMLEREGAALNVAAFVGHSSLRTYVLGPEATERASTPAEVAQMKKLLLEGMAAGAVGFATSTSPAHNGEGGKPMPSRLADDEELRTLVGALGEAGRGTFMLTKGGHTPMPFLEELGALSGRPIVIAALFHNSTNPEAGIKDLDAIAAANARGRRLVGAVSCTPLAMDFTLRSPYVLEGLESWKPALPLKGSEFGQMLKSKAFREGIRAELSKRAHFRLFNNEWDKVEVVESQDKELEGKTIAELAQKRNQDPLDFMLDQDLDTVFAAMLLNYEEAGVARMLRHPSSLVSLSDAGAHLTFFNDAGFGLHLLGHWVRELGVLRIEEAAKKLTSDPAAIFGIRGRGVLEPGAHADLLLFDPVTVGRGPKRRVFDLPGGNPRLTTDARGVHGVWVNGCRVAPDGEALPGKLLREFAP